MKIYAIAKVTFLQIIRQPIFGVLLILALGIMTLAPSVTAFTLDDDNKMLQDLCLSTILVSGLLLAAFSASGAISAEIDDQTILTIVSKPINRLAFIVGKFLGVMGALLLANIFMLITFQLVLRHGVLWAAYIERDVPVLVFGLSAAAIALIFAGLANYMFDWQFSPTAMGLGLPLLSFAAILTGFFDKTWKFQSFGTGYSVDVLYSCILLIFAVWVLAGICLVCSTRLNVVWTLVIAFVVLCLGMIIDWLLLDKTLMAPGTSAVTAASLGFSVLYTLIPNFQAFWMLDALNQADTHITPGYLIQTAGYALCYMGATVFLAYSLFLDRQVGAANKV
jgi:ABC-type transport system involved in multi-copper enzyme maturation permease subunit